MKLKMKTYVFGEGTPLTIFIRSKYPAPHIIVKHEKAGTILDLDSKGFLALSRRIQ